MNPIDLLQGRTIKKVLKLLEDISNTTETRELKTYDLLAKNRGRRLSVATTLEKRSFYQLTSSAVVSRKRPCNHEGS